MAYFDFTPYQLPDQLQELQHEVRTFLIESLADYPNKLRAQTWMGFDETFSKKLASKGWIGMTWPKKYGGYEKSALERYIVVEELLAAGAPVAAHWIADRQSGPVILNFGTETAKERYLPGITRGEIFFCIGMSEPNAGSDLAAINTHAKQVENGWIINGAKVWTTIVHKAHFMIALVRTSKHEGNRHAGLSQFIIDLNAVGVTRKAIADHTGDEHFGEVFLDDVFVDDDMLLGKEGDGWRQVNAELAFERSGPERFLSSYQLLEQFLENTQDNPSELELNLIGNAVAELWTLRQMSVSVNGKLARGEQATLEATVVKDLGACFEQQLPHDVQALKRTDKGDEDINDLNDVLSYLLRMSPSFSLRGGTREILRSIISKGIGLK